MKIVIQRVSQAKVKVNNKVVGKINKGLLLLVGIENPPSPAESACFGEARKIAEKILKLRIFGDKDDKMNLSVQDIKGEILVIPQFTLLADTAQGNRPYFGNAAPPEVAKPIFEQFIGELQKSGLKVELGVFGAKMEVELVNNGPVTIMLDN